MVELLKQGQYQPLPVEQQILVLFAGMNGFVDQLADRRIGRWERELLCRSSSRAAPTCCSTIRAKCTDGKAFNELQELMKAALDRVQQGVRRATSGAAAARRRRR